MDTTATATVLPDSELFLQWGNRKRNRCARATTTTTTNNISRCARDNISLRSNNICNTDLHSPSPFHGISIKPRSLPENENHNHYTTRRAWASIGLSDCNNNINGSSIKKTNINKNNYTSASADAAAVERVWPKLYLGLSNKEKEEDFMAMRGCKPPHRPKKRPKAIQRSVLLVCPGGWLADMCQERYQVREKKSSKKRPRGLKAMGSLDTDSES